MPLTSHALPVAHSLRISSEGKDATHTFLSFFS